MDTHKQVSKAQPIKSLAIEGNHAVEVAAALSKYARRVGPEPLMRT